MLKLTPTIATLALLGAAASAQAATIADDLTVKIKGVVQARATIAPGATDVNGNDQDFYRAQAGGTSENLRFNIRRARLGFDVKNTTGWFGNVTLRADTSNAANAGAGAAYNAELYYAYVGKKFVAEPVEMEVKMGLDKVATFGSLISSGTYITPNERAVSAGFEDPSTNRTVGLAGNVKSEFVNAFVDVGNGATTGRDADSTRASIKPGLLMGGRIEFVPGKDMALPKRQESYVGAEGQGLAIGFDYHVQSNVNSNDPAQGANPNTTRETKTTTYGPDALYHLNGLTMLAEYRVKANTVTGTATNGGAVPAADSPADFENWGASIQAAYAIPMEAGYVVEPALRYTKQDLRGDNQTAIDAGRKATWSAGAENGGAGQQIDAAVNAYWNGHANKTQLGYTRWLAADEAGSAHVVYVQQQIQF